MTCSLHLQTGQHFLTLTTEADQQTKRVCVLRPQRATRFEITALSSRFP